MTKNAWYRVFTHDTGEEQAKEHYRKLYGEDPKEVFRRFNMIWIGPVPNLGDRIDDQASSDCLQTLEPFSQLELPL